ncbi:hypothetical protein AVEN_136394-1 [Araneus ventricosus]|uniref:Uncharacterized protein n=1 Tax=Araneus ventricosus TaxID=182803 RepID=A0A4Y2N2S8_ARAVE|nr:hypothetical protein AVEN_136394-1 [Araneus ventricosus]
MAVAKTTVGMLTAITGYGPTPHEGGNQSIGQYLSVHKDSFSNPPTNRRLEEAIVACHDKLDTTTLQRTSCKVTKNNRSEKSVSDRGVKIRTGSPSPQLGTDVPFSKFVPFGRIRVLSFLLRIRIFGFVPE